MSTTPPMIAAGSCSSSDVSPPGAVTGQTSTHLPQRVQASAMAWARASNAASKVNAADSAELCEEMCVTALT
jgi:hypothetical protein